ncbi:hypothetical protein GCM10011363_45490 [Marivita lacus]|uniref:Glycosyltransferase n=1 Tax=Marivita lacus TaxID=1323742 RepID=A0ABQ1LET2_9RHOB|nr:hypothetical protein GCM10011363_45490 [Marivita lacus]
MKIALLGYLYGLGGIQTHTRILASELAARGHDVRVLTPQAMADHWGPLNAVPGAEVITYGGAMDAVRGFGLRGWADAIVVCGTGRAAMIGALRSGRNCKKIFFEVMSGRSSGPKDPRRMVHLGFDAIVGQGKPVQTRFCQEFRWRGPATTIPALGDQLEVGDRDPAAPLSRPVRMAYFGRLAEHKNVAHLVTEWEKFAQSGDTLDVWGHGDQETPLRAQVAAAGLANTIAIKGRYPDGSAYIDLLKEYDVTLLPTVGEEGAPLVLLESMACGVPFVANGMGGIPDYANPDSAITSGDIQEFIPAVRVILARVRAGTIDRARLQEHYRSIFSTSVLTDRWETFLSDTIAGEAPTA